jgi:hypothetical protein
MTAPTSKRLIARPPVRKPTANQIEAIRRLIRQAGGDHEFQRWIRLAYPRRRGRPPGSNIYGDYDNMVLLIAESISLLSNGKLSLHRVLKKITQTGPLRWTPHRGTSAEAALKRLLAKALAERLASERVTKPEYDRVMNGFITRVGSLDADSQALITAWFAAVLRGSNRSDLSTGIKRK